MLQFNVANVVVGSADASALLPEVRFSVQTEKISLRDLIARTVEQQIADLLDARERTVRDAQLLLDKQYLDEKEIREQAGAGKIAIPQAVLSAQPSIDTAKEVARAVRAFEQQRYMIFINGRQILELDEAISYSEVIDVKFMRLVPLVGG